MSRETYFKVRKWKPEHEDWLIEHKDLKGLQHTWEEFHKAFPETTFTATAISSKRTELQAWGTRRQGGLPRKPLYAERVKKGYIQIKVADNEWWSKAKWVWVATHPGEPFTIRDQFLFLDGNNRNFNPENIRKVNHTIIGILNRTYRGFKEYSPDEKDVLITRIELRIKILDAAEKQGLAKNYGSGRIMKSEASAMQRKYRERKLASMTPEEYADMIQKRKERARKKWQEIKSDPVKLAKYKAYHSEWEKKNRKKKKCIDTNI